MNNPTNPSQQKSKIKIPYRILKTRIVLTLDFPRNLVIGYTDYLITELASSHVNLHCSQEIKIERVLIDHKELSVEKVRQLKYKSVNESYVLKEFIDYDFSKEEDRDDHGLLVIKINGKVGRREMVKLRVFYHIANPIMGIKFFTNRFGEKYLYTHSHLKGARLWFPCLDNTNVFTSFSFEITTDVKYQVICSGTLIEQTQNDKLKTVKFEQSKPIAPQSVAMLVGPFEISPKTYKKNDDLDYVTIFYPKWVQKNIINKIHTGLQQMIPFVENYLDLKYPKVFNSYKIVILDEYYVDSDSYANISIMQTKLLYPSNILEGNIELSCELAYLFAYQYFGNLIVQKRWSDTWLLVGISGYISLLFKEKVFGKNELKYFVYTQIEKLKKLEDYTQPLCNTFFLRPEELMSPYMKVKAPLVINMIANRVGRESFQSLLEKYVSQANYIDYKVAFGLTTDEYDDDNESGGLKDREIKTKEILNKLKKQYSFDSKNFAAFWIYGCGLLELEIGFEFDVARNLIKIAIKQVLPHPNAEIYNGEIVFIVHETSKTQKWTQRISKEYNFFEVNCTTLAKKKQNRGSRGMGVMGVRKLQIPVKWIRFDPELMLLRIINFHQPFTMLINQIEKDMDVIAQTEAIKVMSIYSDSVEAVNILSSFLNSSISYYKVRIDALKALSRFTGVNTNKIAVLRVLEFFKTKYYDDKKEHVLPNDFTSFEEYFIKKEIPLVISKIKDSTTGLTPVTVVDFILQLINMNDNASNDYSDIFYVSNIIKSLGNLDDKFDQIKEILETKLILDKLLPSHNYIITISVLPALTQLIIDRKISFNLNYFYERIMKDYPINVRIESLNSFLRIYSSGNIKDHLNLKEFYNFFNFLLSTFEDVKENSSLKHKFAIKLNKILQIKAAIIQRGFDHGDLDEDEFDVAAVNDFSIISDFLYDIRSTHKKNLQCVQRLWVLIRNNITDQRLRVDMINLYLTLFGYDDPPNCIAGEEKFVQSVIHPPPLIDFDLNSSPHFQGYEQNYDFFDSDRFVLQNDYSNELEKKKEKEKPTNNSPLLERVLTKNKKRKASTQIVLVNKAKKRKIDHRIIIPSPLPQQKQQQRQRQMKKQRKGSTSPSPQSPTINPKEMVKSYPRVPVVTRVIKNIVPTEEEYLKIIKSNKISNLSHNECISRVSEHIGIVKIKTQEYFYSFPILFYFSFGSNTTRVTAKEIYYALPLLPSENDFESQLYGKEVKGLCWFPLVDVPDIGYGRDAKSEVKEGHKEIGYWKEDMNYAVIGYAETYFRRSNASIEFRTPLNIWGRLLYPSHINEKVLMKLYGGIVSVVRPKRIVLSLFLKDDDDFRADIEVDLYDNDVADFLHQSLAKCLVLKSPVLWFYHPNSYDVKYFSIKTENEETNRYESFLDVLENDIGNENAPLSERSFEVRKRLSKNEVAIDIQNGSIVLSHPKKNNTYVVNKCPIVGRIATKYEDFWKKITHLDDPANQITNGLISVTLRLIKIKVGKREFRIELYDSCVADYIYKHLPIISQVIKHNSFNNQLACMKLSDEFCKGIPYSYNKNHDSMYFGSQQIGFWKNGKSLVFPNGNHIDFDCNIWGVFKTVGSYSLVNINDFKNGDIVRLEKIF